jgi:arginine-tRNA-protein transferase
MKRSVFDPEEFALYKKYQIRVHKDKPKKVNESSYRRFLVETPVIFVPPRNDNLAPPCGFGSLHQQYLIDGKLVAVGVVDILPRCLSSKYMFWDPDLAFLSLGKYSALEEIKWVREAQKLCPTLQYYYLGYYIHSCPKMRYKAAYNPSELLCPVRYQWIPFQDTKPVLDKTAYACLSDFCDDSKPILNPVDEMHVIQDMLVPLYKVADALEFQHREMEIYPIWLCPHHLFKLPVKTTVYPEPGFE